MLGRPYEVRGKGDRGDGRGRELGFPTANVRVDRSVLLPEDGVFAGWFERADGSVHAAPISLGTRPHFYDDGDRLLEAYLLDFDGDLYGEPVRVRVVELLRPQQVFAGLDDLVEQLHRDVDAARTALA